MITFHIPTYIGNHECVAVINNFVDIEDVKYYSKKQPFEEKPKLPRAMVEPLHRLVMTVNIILKTILDFSD